MLPFEPETAQSLRVRFPAALGPVYTEAGLRDREKAHPASMRLHTFDRPDGLRLLVWRLDSRRLGEVVHASATAVSDSPFASRLYDSPNPRALFQAEAWELFMDLCDRTFRRVLLFQVESSTGRPHWFTTAADPPK